MTASQRFRRLVLMLCLISSTVIPLHGSASTPKAGSGATPAFDVVVEGRYDVGGHSLYLRCVGSGSPTIMYLHGFSPDGNANSISALSLPSRLKALTRICVYDRANLGRSDAVPGPLTGERSVRDLHVLLETAGIEPPYILLGASFGGLLAYQFALMYPDQVSGMLLLDAAFPDELPLDALLPPEYHFTHDEWPHLTEQLDQLSVYEATQAMRGNEPPIPVIYLLATPSNWPLGVPAYDAVVHEALATYIGSFSPGIIKEVPSAHWMEEDVPEVIVEEMAALLEMIRER